MSEQDKIEDVSVGMKPQAGGKQIIDNGYYKLNVQRMPPIVLEATADMRKIAQALGGLREDHAKMPEEVFKEHFLPIFNGEKEMPPDGQVYANWVGLAGSPTAEVDIVNAKGEVVITTPPLMDTSGIAMLRKKGHGLNAIMTNYELEKESFPEAASINRDRALEERQKDILTVGDTGTNRERWAKVFSHFKDGGDKPAAATSTRELAEDDAEYE